MTQQPDKDLIFALDIGTRSVIGIAGYQKGDLFSVCCMEKELYQKRVVVDGQIEDVEKTAETAGIVKRRIEEKLGVSLKYVHIAAAGRALHTVETHEEMEITDEIIDDSFIKKLEFSAIEKAYAAMEAQGNHTFYCVGNGVQKYVLDDYEISTLLNHKGKKAEVFMIATFLPKEVVETLYTTMRRIGLTVSSLTLEPIAAMNALIPPELRKLNLTLCDIGAGTADIAVCKGGSVSGYTMATVAGDEITEAVMETCLVDFQTAEEIKFRLAEFVEEAPQTIVCYEDILGIGHEEEAGHIFQQIRSVIEHLAEVICQKVLEINGNAPAAMFLVGGGSQTPMLRSMVAEGLGMDRSKVAVGSNVYMKKIAESEADIFSPEYATPLGIALTAGLENTTDVFAVSVNGEKIRLFQTWDTTVLGVLQMSGYRYGQIMGQSGRSLVFHLNGEQRSLRGGIPSPSEVSVNGEKAPLSQMIMPGDEITFLPSQAGQDAQLTVDTLLGEEGLFHIMLNDTPYGIKKSVKINGKTVSLESEIQNGDTVEITDMVTLGELRRELGKDGSEEEILINGERMTPDYLLKEGDIVYALDSIQKQERSKETVPTFGQEAVKAGKGLQVILNGGSLELPPKADGTEYQFFDLLAFLDIDPKNPQGNIVQVLNGKEASYIEVLKDGDEAEIYWGA